MQKIIRLCSYAAEQSLCSLVLFVKEVMCLAIGFLRLCKHQTSFRSSNIKVTDERCEVCTT